MTASQALLLAILSTTIAAFVWGRWRHDMVALGSLLACVLFGLVPSSEAFAGFGHPAVVTVACVLVLSRGLQTSGAVDMAVRHAIPQSAGSTLTIASLTGVAALLSAFMNNVGALALLMPVAIQIASRHKLAPGKVLMPIAFGSILGGMTTLIGTPPNLIVSGFRAERGGESFGMFDFTPVGAAVALVGVTFIVVIGTRLVPARTRAGVEGFETSAYLTEARVLEKGKAAGMALRDMEGALAKADAQVVGLVRNEKRILAPNLIREVRAGDILVFEAEPEALAAVISTLGLKLEEDVRSETGKRNADLPEESDSDAAEAAANANQPADGPALAGTDVKRTIQSDEIVLMELAVLPDSEFVGRSATDIRLRSRFGINLLAVSRQGQRSMSRLRTMAIRRGDVLLMQGAPDAIAEFAGQFGCVPLAERPLRIPDARQALRATGILAAAVAAAAFGLVPAAVAFAAAVLTGMATRVIPTRTVYRAVDWPVIVLLAALIPVAGAMATTGTADVIAQVLLEGVARGYPLIGLVLILIVTMTLSDFMNNAATAAVMCPVAIGAAERLSVNPDPFLMAVAVGASCAFLTPIGHQNNTLIMGPGGFHFGDFWRLGLPLEIMVVVVGIPMILWIWPL